MKTDIPVTIRDLEKIFKLMINNRKDREHYAFKRMWTLCAFGCRPGEMSELKPTMIFLDEDRIEFDTEKTHVIRHNFYSGLTKKILEDYLEDNRILNVAEGNIWSSIKKYSKPFGKKLYPRLGRNAFMTNMDGIVSDNEKLKKKYGVPKLGSEFTKVMTGHKVTDMTEMYKRYPLPLIKDVMINYHYLNDLGKKIERLL
jgi:integrase